MKYVKISHSWNWDLMIITNYFGIGNYISRNERDMDQINQDVRVVW